MTHCERILEILSDGEWHEKSEFYAFCVAHSRISELRNQQGYVIDKEHRRGKVYYRLGSLRTDAQIERLGPDGCASVRSEPSSLALPDPPEASGHVTNPGPASSDASPPDVDVADLQLELDLIERKLDAPILVDSENARSTRAILARQRSEIRDTLARVA